MNKNINRCRGYAIDIFYLKSRQNTRTSVVDEHHEATRVVGIDIGVDNLTAIAFTSGHCPVLIKGNEIKAVNQYYNKQIAHYRSLLRIEKEG